MQKQTEVAEAAASAPKTSPHTSESKTSEYRPRRIALSYVMDAVNVPQDYADELHGLAANTGRSIVEVSGVEVGGVEIGGHVQPWFIDALRPGRSAREVVAGADAVVILGGADVHPRFYELERERWRDVDLAGVSASADEFEIALVHETLAARKPLLGICRGLQIINVALGGTLIPDIGRPTIHKSEPDGDGWADHSVSLAVGSAIESIYGTRQITVRSAHHQAVDALAEGLVTVATAPDGLIEAAEHPEHPTMLAVQWHPEDLYGDKTHLDALMSWFLRQIP